MKRFGETFRLLPTEQRIVLALVILLVAFSFAVKYHRKAAENFSAPTPAPSHSPQIAD